MIDEAVKIGVCVRCLPVAGRENPYQYLMLEGLNSAGIDASSGKGGKLLAVWRTAQHDRPDYIHFDWIGRYYHRRHVLLTWLHAPLFILELFLTRIVFGCRYVWTLHNLRGHDSDSVVGIERWVQRRLAKLCDWIRVFDETTVCRAQVILDVPHSMFRVVPEGSYVGYYANGVKEDEARMRLELKPPDFVLLYIGGIRPYKGIEDLLDAFDRYRHPDWRLVVAGRPLVSSYAEEIKRKALDIPGVLLFLKFVPDEELQIFFSAADVVVLPFKMIENSGSVILGMSFKKPIIAPAMGVLPSRLAMQPELLYTPGKLHEAIQGLAAVPREHLRKLGCLNYEALSSSTWPDFAVLFRR